MGVIGLKTLAEKNGMCNYINMRREIENFSRQLRNRPHRHDKNECGLQKPIIIFDLLSVCYLFLRGTVGILGGRHEFNLRIIRTIFQKLIDSGADLVFFCDGPIQNNKINEWCKRRNEKHEGIIKCMEQGEAGNGLIFQCTLFVNKVVNLLAQIECEVIVSTSVDCDQAMAKYAIENKQNVLAVVSGDTDMLIFEGDFQLWIINNVEDFECANAKRLDRQQLLTFLNLTRNQMKFYATIKGNDFTRHCMYGRKKVMINMTPSEVSSLVKEKFSSVSELNDNLYKMIARVLLKEDVTMTDDHLKSIEQSLKFYELNFMLEPSEESVNVLKYCLENGYAFQYSAQFLDFKQRCNNKFINLILEVMERSAGILKEHQPDNSHLDKIVIITKTGAKRTYEDHGLAPQPRKRLENEQNGNYIEWKNLIFCLGLHLSTYQLETVIRSQMGIVKVILSILFLYQAKEITPSQADALIVVHCENSASDLQDPIRSNHETIRTAQAYLRTLTLVDDILHICGLSEYTGTINVKRKPMLKFVNNVINAMYHNTTDPFWTGRVMDFLFDGVEIDCTSEYFGVRAVCSIFEAGDIKSIVPLRENFFKFSVLGGMNGSGTDMYEVKRGVKNFRDVGRIVSFGNKTEMDVWGGDECNRYKGTDSTIFPRDIQKEDGLWSYEPEICMSIGAHYDRESNYQGVPTMRFTLDFGDARTNKDLECYCGDPPNDCPRRGTRNLFDCIDAPLILSLPHFYNADPSILCQFQSGLNPNQIEHSFYMDYERASGNVPNAVKRYQVNMDVVPIDEVESMKHLPEVIMPLLWIEEITTSAPLKNYTHTNTQNYQQYNLILQIIQWLAIITGTVGTIFSTYMYFKIRRATTVIHIKNGGENATITSNAAVYKIS